MISALFRRPVALLLGLLAVFAVPVLPAEDAAPAADAKSAVWDTLPDKAWLVISLPDTAHARQAFAAGKLNALGKLPGIADFVADVQGFYQKNVDTFVAEKMLTPWLKTLHLDPKKLIDVPSGELTFAVINVAPAEQRFDLVLRLGLAEQAQADGLNDLIDQALAMRPELPLQKREMKFGDARAHALEIPEANLGAYFSTTDKTLLVGTDPDRFGQMLSHKPAVLDKETTLKDSALGKAMVATLGGAPDLLLYFNLGAIPQQVLNDPGQQRLVAGAERLGIRKVCYALRFDDASGNVLETYLVEFNPDVWQPEAALTQPVDLSTFERGPGGTIAQFSVNVNWPRAWNVLTTFMKQGPNAAEGDRIVKSLEDFFGMKIPDLLACLDGQVTANVALPRTPTGFVANVIPDATVRLGLNDADKTVAAVGKFHEWFAANANADKQFEPAKIDVEGARAAWLYAPPGRHNPLKPVLIVDDKTLLFAPMMPMADHARRATPYGPQLAEREDWQKLKSSIPAKSFLVGYLDLATAAELGYNFGTYAATMAPSNPFAKYHLPQGDQVGKLFTGWLVSAHADGNVVVFQSQSPVGLLPGVATTALLAKFFEVSEKTQRLIARRDSAAQRLKAMYSALSQFNAANKKLPAKLSELYPDQLKNIADFTVADQAWSMNPAGNGDRLRALIDDRVEFVMVPLNFGTGGKVFLVPKQMALEADQGVPVLNGDGQVQMLTADEYTALLDKVPDAAGGGNNNEQPRHGWRGRGGEHPGGPGGPGGPGMGGPKREPAPLPPAQNNPDEGF